MRFDTITAATYAAQKLDSLLERASRDTETVIVEGDIVQAVVYFAELRDKIKGLQTQVSALQKHIDSISQDLLPTMFQNQNVKTIKVDNVGRVTVADRWSCSILKPDDAFEFLRKSGNGGMIKPTVHPMTMGAHAKDENVAGRPLPEDLFKVTATPYTSITKS